jgi:glycosyltransferase involved in cell wall biosynthesis
MSESLPKVSIILPTYNGARYVRQSIDSCINQTYKNIELIIVDDGSTDNTHGIITFYKDERVKYLRHVKNEGLPYALNTGFSKATGKYLTWTSDDNQYLPMAIEEMVSFLEKNINVDLVYADYWAHFLETGKQELRRMPDNLDLQKTNQVGPCFLYSRRVYEEVGAYDPKYLLVEDYDYWIRIYKKFKTARYPRPLYIYGEHSKTLKRTRHIEIVLSEVILKHRYNFTSLSELSDSFLKSFQAGDYSSPPITTESSSMAFPKKLFSYLKSSIKVSRQSPPLSLLFLVLLTRLSVSTILRFYISRTLEYTSFLFWSSTGSFHLNVIKGRKNILCIVPYMVMGGAEKVLLNIAQETNREEFSFHLVTTFPANNAWHEKFKTHFLNIVILNRKLKNIYYKYFRQLIKKLNIDIVLISNSVVGYEHLPWLKSEFKNVKIMDVLHAEDWPPADLVELSTPYIDRRICISQHLRDYWADRYARSGPNEKYVERLRVIHSGIDTREYNPNVHQRGRFKSRFLIPQEVKIISFIGRFSDEKNPFLFVEIAKNITARFPNEFKFVMAGDGPQFGKVKDMIKNYGLEDHFLLTGMIDDVAELLNDTYILLIVSKIEGIPLVVLEAMNMGVPVISTDVGGITEVVKNNFNGYLINVGDRAAELFANKIQDLVNGKLDYAGLAEKARKTIVSNFSVKTMAEGFQNIFNELTEDHRSV